MARPGPISGFPEWLPEQRMIEQQVLDALRVGFELHGFVPIETRAVEPLEQLLAKGETDKEIYVLRRLHASDEEGDAGLGLHFDMTVPFARYVVEHAGKLSFPLRRYQIQKAWRGERPQEGRFREFVQADFDVIGRGQLPFQYDVELPLVLHEVWSALPLPPLRLHVNNRKINEGVYRSVGIKDIQGVLRAVDKLDKLGERGVSELLVGQVGCSEEQARVCLALACISSADDAFVEEVRALGVHDALLDEGLSELAEVVAAGRELAPGLMIADLRIARGLDYYTGTVYETVMVGHEALGSVCSGALRQPRQRRRQAGVSGGGAVDRRDAGARALVRPWAAAGEPQHANVCAGGAAGRAGPAALQPARRDLAGSGHPNGGGGRAGEVRQADPLRGAARHPVCVVPAGRVGRR